MTRQAVPEPRFSTFIRARKREILAEWEQVVRQLPSARDLERPALLDQVPALLDRIAATADELASGLRPHMPADLAGAHALQRLGAGYDLPRVVAEYGALRDCIVRLWFTERARPDMDSVGICALNQAIDGAIAMSVDQFARARDTLQAEEQARRAELEAVIESIPEAVLIGTADGITRANRAALELAGWSSGDELRRPIGELLREVDARDLETGQPIRDDGAFVQALQGRANVREVRLRHRGSGREIIARAAAAPVRLGDRVIGAVAVISDITEQRRTRVALEQALAEQHAARAEAERTLAVIDTILAASSVGIGFIDTELRYVRINDALAALNGVPADRHIGRTVREVLGDQAADLVEPILRRILETREPVESLELEGAPAAIPDQPRSLLASYVPVVTAHGDLFGIGAVLIDVTERKRMEMALRERELWLRSLADNIPQLAWMADETGAVTWYNQRWYEYTGTTFDQVRGWGWQIVQHPDHAARVLEKVRGLAGRGQGWEDTFPLRGADGRYRWFLVRAVPIRDDGGRVVRWFGTGTDVTEQRFMHEAMNVLSSSLDGHAMLDRIARLAVPALADWCVIDVAEGARIERVAMVGDDPANAELARTVAAAFPPDREGPHGVLEVIRTGATRYVPEIGGEQLASAIRDPEQLRIARALDPGSLVVVPLVARDRTLGAIAFVSAGPGHRYTPADVAVMEEIGRRVGLALDNARLFAQAQRDAGMREEILAVVSHDLKNPLGTIHLAASMMLEDPDPRTRKRNEAILRAANRMDHLIADLLDLANIQAGRLAVDRKQEDAASLAREAIDANEPMAREQGLTLLPVLELPEVQLCVDRDRLLQVFGNLLGNAIKFCGHGGTITVRGERRGSEALFSVTDTGPGISDTDLPHIFEPYWSGRKHRKKGTGLGLYISKSIVEAHGGRIWVESKPGAGTTFTFTIPLAQAVSG